ncbi:MAG: hypothetical protein JRJ69_10365 [Deltaproteobacteria bacterium]|nr:hypothetical protein [Deltaproteobacteria bacterium]
MRYEEWEHLPEEEKLRRALAACKQCLQEVETNLEQVLDAACDDDAPSCSYYARIALRTIEKFFKVGRRQLHDHAVYW